MPTTDAKSNIVHSWAYGEDAWHTGMDANLKRISRSGYHLSALDRDLFTPPGSPSDGDTYIVAAGGTGAWASKDGNIAYWDGSAWQFFVPNEGWYCDVADEDSLYRYDGTDWNEYAADTGGGSTAAGQWEFVETIALSANAAVKTAITVPTGCGKIKLVAERHASTAANHDIRIAVTGDAGLNYSYTRYTHATNSGTPTNNQGESQQYVYAAFIAMAANSLSDGEVIIGLGTASTYTSFMGQFVSTNANSANSPVAAHHIFSGSHKATGRPSSIDYWSNFGDYSGNLHVYKSTY